MSALLTLLQSQQEEIKKPELKFGQIQQPTIIWNQEIVEKRDYAALHYKMSNGENTVIFGAGLNYKDENGNFQRVRPTLVDKGTYWGMQSAKADLRLPKTFKNPKLLAGNSWNHTVNSNNVLGELFYIGDQIDSVPIYGIRYPNAYTGVDVEYKPIWNGVHEEYVIKSPASVHTFEIDKPTGSIKVKKNNKTEISAGKLKIRDFQILDNTQKPKVFEPDIIETPTKFILTVPIQPFSEYPITLDPSPFDSDADNSAFFDTKIVYDPGVLDGCPGTGAFWATLHNNTGSTNVTATVNVADAYAQTIVNNYNSSCWEAVDRLAHNIDTDSIGSGSTISSSTYKISIQTSSDDAGVGSTANDSAGYILVASKVATSSNPTAADFEMFGDEIAAEKAEQIGPEINFDLVNNGRGILIYSTTTYTQYISLTGTTTLGLIVRGDQLDVAFACGSCTSSATNYWNTSLEAVEAARPSLLVAYSVAATAALPRRPDVIWFSSE